MNPTNAALFQRLVVKHIQQHTKNFKTFIFEDSPRIAYRSGQYLTLVAYNNAGEEVRRSYSITAAPVLQEPLSIGVKRVENGFFSRYLFDEVRVGDELLTTGAGGLFLLPEPVGHAQQFFFLAAGSGITPIFSLVKTLLVQQVTASVVLVYSNAAPETAVFLNELSVLQQRHPNRFHLELLFSNAADLTKARLYRELLMELVHKYAAMPLSKLLFYVCGPEAYMRMCTFVLREHGVPKNNIRKESFLVYRNMPKALPPDKQTHMVTLQIGGKEYQVTVKYPNSILQAAKKQQVSLPYSCESGRCGNCAAVCVAGNIWLSYNEVLTSQDLKNGLTLTCVGHPVGGDAVLKLK